jgi:hypothetical protein
MGLLLFRILVCFQREKAKVSIASFVALGTVIGITACSVLKHRVQMGAKQLNH